MSAPRSVDALVVGDSFAAGSGVKDPNAAYPELLAKATGMRVELDAEGGTGFINRGPGAQDGSTSRLVDRLDSTASRFPDVGLVIVDAGRNDLDSSVDALAAAASDYLLRARRHWPHAELVVIIPTFIGAQQREGYERLQRQFGEAADRVGATVIDPVTDRWYDGGPTSGLLDSDNVHPNAQGHALIAESLERSLRSHDVRLGQLS